MSNTTRYLPYPRRSANSGITGSRSSSGQDQQFDQAMNSGYPNNYDLRNKEDPYMTAMVQQGVGYQRQMANQQRGDFWRARGQDQTQGDVDYQRSLRAFNKQQQYDSREAAKDRAHKKDMETLRRRGSRYGSVAVKAFPSRAEIEAETALNQTLAELKLGMERLKNERQISMMQDATARSGQDKAVEQSIYSSMYNNMDQYKYWS